MTEYFYKIVPALPTIIWVNPDPSGRRRRRWRRWGEMSSAAQAVRLLQMLRKEEPLSEEDAKAVVME